MKKALDSMKDVQEIIHKWLKNKTISRLHCICLLAEANLWEANLEAETLWIMLTSASIVENISVIGAE